MPQNIKDLENTEIIMMPQDDIDNINIRDYIGDNLVKVYPYQASYGTKNKTFINQDSTTVVRITQDSVIQFNNLYEDDNQNKYMELFAAVDENTEITVTPKSETFQKDIRKLKTFTAITNDYVETDDDKPIFVTIGEPFDKAKADSGEQIIYYVASTTLSYPGTIRELGEIGYDVDLETRVSELVLQDVAELEQNFNALFKFRITSLPLDNISNITIKTLPNIIIDKVKVKGISNEVDSELIDVDFKTTGSELSWFNVIPITTKDKIEVTTPWFDDNITMEKTMVENILKAPVTKLSGESQFSWVEFCTQYNISDSAKDLILDMLLYSYEFANTFGDVPRTTEGAMVPKYLLGTQKVFVSSIANTTASQTITGLYRKWRKLNPDLVDNFSDNIIKQFVAALSQEIASDLSVAGGENDFNKNVLPWRIKLVESIKPDIDDRKDGDNVADADKQGWINLKDFKFKLDENPYFKIDETKKTVEILEEIDLSESKWIESERRIILPELPETITAIDKINNVGDFSTTSSRDLKYMLKLPLANDEIDKLFKGDLGTAGKKTITYTGRALNEKLNPYSDAEAEKIIKENILRMYPDAANIVLKKQGEDVIINNQSKYLISASFAGSSKSFWNGRGGTNIVDKSIAAQSDDAFNAHIKDIRTLPAGNYARWNNVWDPVKQVWFSKISGSSIKDNEERKGYFLDEISSFYGVSKSDIKLDVFLVTGETNTGGYYNFIYSFHILRHSYQNYEYSFETNLPSKELINRQTIYDRPKWKQLIKSAINPNTGIIRDITLEEKYNTGPYELKEIIFSSLFGDTIWIDFSNGDEMEIKLNQRDDETASTQKILFY